MTLHKAAVRPRWQDADQRVAARVRERRIALGMTKQRLAELLGVSYQQEHKYETGVTRLPAGRLHQLSRVLGVEVGYFFEGLQHEPMFAPTTQQRMLVELTRDFGRIRDHRHREALAVLARVLAAPESGNRLLG
jgi:transcriptional regulator with XRE-family HTH domain